MKQARVGRSKADLSLMLAEPTMTVMSSTMSSLSCTYTCSDTSRPPSLPAPPGAMT